MIEAPDIPIIRTVIDGHDGYLACGDSSGVFAYREAGKWMDKEYDKIRVCLAFKKPPHPKGKEHAQPYELKKLAVNEKALKQKVPKTLERIGLYPFLVIPLIKILAMLAKEEYGLYVGDDHGDYQQELDDLYKKMGIGGERRVI